MYSEDIDDKNILINSYAKILMINCYTINFKQVNKTSHEIHYTSSGQQQSMKTFFIKLDSKSEKL